MRIATLAAALATSLVLVTLGCMTNKPIQSVSDMPISTTKSNPTLGEIGKVIISAGVSLGWQMKETKPGNIVGTYSTQNLIAVVDVNYSTKSYSIVHKDSTGLSYTGQTVHERYNMWVRNLDQRIRAQLSAL
jgi:hypothetical protein